jgi:alpha-1,6-mannosyltransferase
VAATIATLVLGRSQVLALRVAPLLCALAGAGALLLLARRGRGPSTRAVVGTSILLAVVAVALPPLHSRDVYLYGMQGRVLAVHGANPYVHEPGDFADDPMLDEVSPPWHDDASYYGPAFTVVEAGVAAVAGPSPLAVRLLFQLLAAGAVLGALALLHRAGVEAGGLVLVGLNPITVVKGINEGHVDVLLGLVLLAAVLAARQRPLAGAALVGLAGLIKSFALVAVVGLAAWLLLRRGRRPAVAAGAISTALVGIGYLLAGGPVAVEPLREAGLQQSRTSLWARPRLLLTESWVAQGRDGSDAGRAARQLVAVLALVTVAVVLVALVVVILRRADARTAPDPALAVAGAFVAYLVASVYVPAWYVTAVLPVAAVCWRSRLAVVVAVHGALLGVAYTYSAHLAADPLAPVLRAGSTWGVPAAQAALVIVVLARAALIPLRAMSPVPGASRT